MHVKTHDREMPGNAREIPGNAVKNQSMIVKNQQWPWMGLNDLTGRTICSGVWSPKHMWLACKKKNNISTCFNTCYSVQVQSSSLQLAPARALDVQFSSFLWSKAARLAIWRNHPAVWNRPVAVRTRDMSFKIMVQKPSNQQDRPGQKAKRDKAQTTMETLPRCSPVATLQDGGSQEPQAALKRKRDMLVSAASELELSASEAISAMRLYASSKDGEEDVLAAAAKVRKTLLQQQQETTKKRPSPATAGNLSELCAVTIQSIILYYFHIWGSGQGPKKKVKQIASQADVDFFALPSATPFMVQILVCGIFFKMIMIHIDSLRGAGQASRTGGNESARTMGRTQAVNSFRWSGLNMDWDHKKTGKKSFTLAAPPGSQAGAKNIEIKFWPYLDWKVHAMVFWRMSKRHLIVLDGIKATCVHGICTIYDKSLHVAIPH